MASASTADTWREAGGRAERRTAHRPEAAEYVSRIGRPPVPPPPARLRSTELPPFPEHRARAARSRDGDRRAPAQGRPAAVRSRRSSRPAEHSRPVGSDPAERSQGGEDREGRRRGPRPAEPHAAGRIAPTPERRGRLSGAVAVLLAFLVTLGGAALDSWLGVGLGLITLVALIGATALSTLLVRRRDLLTPVVAPPLVFVVVATLNTALAPSASLNLASMATLLIRGFPTMVIATGVGIVVALLRWAARR